MDNVTDIDPPLQCPVNLTTNEADNKDETYEPLKKKISLKVKNVLSRVPKKVQKRQRKGCDRVTKASAKQYNNSFKLYLSGINCLEEEQKYSIVPSETNNILPLIEIFNKYNFHYEMKPDVSKQHDNIYLQDHFMNTFFKYYPEFICVDSICEIISLELNLYLFLGCDSNGHCEIIAIGLFKSCESGLEWFCDVFKKCNLNWRKTRLIMCDKRARNVEILKSFFPEKLVFISFFHSIKTFKKDLLNLDCKITDNDFNKIVQVFEQMIFASEESIYLELLKQMKSMPPSVSAYFRKTWHQKKDSWVLQKHLDSKLFLKSFNFYLNKIQKTVRPLINTLDSVENVMKTLSSCIEKMRFERFKKFTSVFSPFRQTSQLKIIHKAITYKYSRILTPQAVELIAEQLNISLEVRNIKKLSTGKYICTSEDIVTIYTCSCNFFQLLLLPCSHIFSLRRLLSLPLYVESLCSLRWISSNYHRTFSDLQMVFTEIFKKTYPEKTLNFDSFNKCFNLSSDIWPNILCSTEDKSQERLLVFNNILRAWKNGLKISIKTDSSNEASKKQIGEISASFVKEISQNMVSAPTLDNWRDMHGISLVDVLNSDNDVSVLPFNL